MEERKTYTDEELSVVLEKHRVMLSVGTFIMYAAVVVILGGTLASAVFEFEELRYSLYIGYFISQQGHQNAVGRGAGSRGTERCF